MMSTPASMARSSVMYAMPLVKWVCRPTGIDSSRFNRPTSAAASSGDSRPAMSLMQRLSAPMRSSVRAFSTK